MLDKATDAPAPSRGQQLFVAFVVVGLITAAVFIVGALTAPEAPEAPHMVAPSPTAPADEDPVARASATELTKTPGKTPPQQHPPQACGPDDHACVIAWFDEYKTGILGELRQWQSFEPRALSAMQSHDDLDAAWMLGEAIGNEWYKHNRWAMADNWAIVQAGVDPGVWDDLFSCRTAVLNFKWWLVSVAESMQQSEIASTRADYLQSLSRCRKRFKGEVD
jgi:hypothetical protein